MTASGEASYLAVPGVHFLLQPAHRLSWVEVTFWTIAPLSTHLAKLLSWVGVGRLDEVPPVVWLHRTLYELTLFWNWLRMPA